MKKETARIILYQLCRSRDVIAAINTEPEKAKDITTAFAFEVSAGTTAPMVDEFFQTEHGQKVARQFGV